jgi:hypothetical protein
MEQNMIFRIIHNLNEMIPKSDNMTKGIHDNKGSIYVEQTSINKSVPGGFNSYIGVNHRCIPKGIKFPKVKLRIFYGIDVFTWVPNT